jgi:lipoprotein-releasing system permease protein
VSMGHPYTAIAGARILNDLGADVTNIFSNIELFYLNPAVTNPEANPTAAYQSLTLHPAGEFTVGDEFDDKYILAPLPLVQDLFRQPGLYSSIEIKTQPGAAASTIKQLQDLFGTTFKVESRYQQNGTMYMIMNAEKWAVYAILVLVLLISSFNMVGALSMLVLEKKKDIAILRAMGALPPAIRKIFLVEGLLWALVGGIAGIALGCIVCVIQQRFAIVKLAGSNFVVDAYPVEIQLRDIALVFLTIVTVGLLAAWYPSVRATTVAEPSLKSN